LSDAQMAIRVRLQIVRKGTKYESFRITIPRAIIEALDLKKKDFLLNIKGKRIELTPTGKRQ